MSRPRTDPIDRIMARVTKTLGPLNTPCWITDYANNGDGYTHMKLPTGVFRRCHIVTYEHFIGPMPIGLILDHLCRIRACVNPIHVEPVTVRENNLRGMSVGARAIRTGLCKRGHSLADAYVIPLGRSCRECARLRNTGHLTP